MALQSMSDIWGRSMIRIFWYLSESEWRLSWYRFVIHSDSAGTALIIYDNVITSTRIVATGNFANNNTTNHSYKKYWNNMEISCSITCNFISHQSWTRQQTAQVQSTSTHINPAKMVLANVRTIITAELSTPIKQKRCMVNRAYRHFSTCFIYTCFHYYLMLG